MKTITEAINGKDKIELGTIGFGPRDNKDNAFMAYDENSRTVTVFQYDTIDELIAYYDSDDSSFEQLDNIKEGESMWIDNALYTRIW